MDFFFLEGYATHPPRGKKVYVKQFYIEGNTVLSTKNIQKALLPYTNRELSFRDLNCAIRAVEKAYSDEGFFLVRVLLPPQKIEDNIVTLQVIEGKLGAIEVTGNEHYRSVFIKKYFRSLQGKVVNYNSFLKQLFLLNENIKLKAESIFTKGDSKETTNAIIRIHDKDPFRIFVDYNNYGSLFTAKHRFGSKIEYGNFLIDGDVISVSGVVGLPPTALNFIDGAYQVPLNQYGTKMKFAYMHSNFRLRDEFTTLDSGGNSKVGGVNLSHPFIRTERMNLDFYSNFDIKNIANFTLSQTNSEDRLRVISMGMNFDYIDTFHGRTFLFTSSAYGIPDILGGSKAVDPSSSRSGAGVRFFKSNLTLQRAQSLGVRTLLILKASGQWTPYKLPLPEQTYIGGPDTVRGFVQAAALGDYGYITNVELRIPPPFIANIPVPIVKKKKWKEVLQILAFVDYGAVFLKGGDPGLIKAVHLAGTGVGLRVFGPLGIDLNVDWGFPIHGKDLVNASSSEVYVKVSLNLL